MFNRAATPDPRTTDSNLPTNNHAMPPMSGPTPSGATHGQASGFGVPPAGHKPPPPFASNGLQQPVRAGDVPTSVLGQDITISGQQLVLKTKGSLLIAGHIHGDVHGESITVGETGSVSGVITARTITIQGQVHGALKGSSVVLNATARVDGDIVKQTLAIAEGAQFDGSVRRAKDLSEVTPDLG